MRLITKVVKGNHSATIYYNSSLREYVVRFCTNGVHNVWADYFTDSKGDAIGTAEHQIKLVKEEPTMEKVTVSIKLHTVFEITEAEFHVVHDLVGDSDSAIQFIKAQYEVSEETSKLVCQEIWDQFKEESTGNKVTVTIKVTKDFEITKAERNLVLDLVNDKFKAIKFIRAQYDLPLIEAKRICEAVWSTP